MTITPQMRPEELPFILNAVQAAAWLGLKPATLCRMANRGDLPAGRIGGRPVFKRDDIIASIDTKGKAHTISSTRRGRVSSSPAFTPSHTTGSPAGASFKRTTALSREG